MPLSPARPLLRQDVLAGSQPLADEQEIINRTLAPYAGERGHAGDPIGGLKIVRLSAQIGADESSSAASVGRTGVLQAYNPNVGDWEDTNTQFTNITDPLGVVWDKNYRAFVLYDRQSGQRVPINPVFCRHARTVENHDGSYPGRGSTVFPIRFTQITYTRQAGRQTPTVTFLDDSGDPDDYVLNVVVAESSDSDRTYIAKGSDIRVLAIFPEGQAKWITRYCCGSPDESSSSSP